MTTTPTILRLTRHDFESETYSGELEVVWEGGDPGRHEGEHYYAGHKWATLETQRDLISPGEYHVWPRPGLIQEIRELANLPGIGASHLNDYDTIDYGVFRIPEEGAVEPPDRPPYVIFYANAESTNRPPPTRGLLLGHSIVGTSDNDDVPYLSRGLTALSGLCQELDFQTREGREVRLCVRNHPDFQRCLRACTNP